MSGVWVFKNGVVRLVENSDCHGANGLRKVLVHLPSNEVITSYAVLERKLYSLGWERYYDEPELLQYHKRSTVHLISLPKDFNRFKSMHMFDIVVKNRNEFENGVVRLVENPGDFHGATGRRKVLVHLSSNEVITSYAVLERKLYSLGWERYYDDPDLLQFHKRSTVHLISLPKDFNNLKSMHMYDIVVKNRNEFTVRDM
uniref:Flowering-promoting factor 1-like protein 3 n=1 Tax=Solanum lycopersicum TaxID=4081 RepID=A0A3Q7EZG6_SOLLC